MKAKADASLTEVNEFLLDKQNFDCRREESAGQLLDRLAGFYGSAPTCYLSLLARAPGFRFEELDEAFAARRLARLRCMRASLFLLPVPSFATAFQATRRQCVTAFNRLVEAGGVRRPVYERVAARVEEALRDRRLTAAELKSGLADEDAAVLRALNFILSLMCEEGRLVRARARGGWKSNLWEYALLDAWLPGVHLDTVAPVEARAALARSYFESFGPATLEDFQWWSGFNVAETHAALEAQGASLRPLSIEGLEGDYLMLDGEAPRLGAKRRRGAGPRVSLLPMWDAYTMAYRSKGRYLDERRRPYVYDRAGNAAPALLLDGRVGGLWEWTLKKREAVVRVALFEKAEAVVWGELKVAAGRFARAVGCEAALLQRCPLPRVGAGADINFRSSLAGLEGEAVT